MEDVLRAKRAPMIIAIPDAHFTEDARRIPVPEFVNLVDVDLDDIRTRTSIEVTKSAQAYCDKWRTDGYLVRRPVAQTRQETYGLSGGALMAIGYAKRMLQPHRAATQSRLGIIINQVSSLALATDANEGRRRQALREERDRIDRKLALLDQGHIDVIDHDKAAERTRGIVSLAREIPADFVHVRNDFERINRSLEFSLYSPGTHLQIKAKNSRNAQVVEFLDELQAIAQGTWDDEAFDKADPAFARTAMDIFGVFGFHMILATPYKLISVLQPYIGTVAAVSCRESKYSSLTLVDFEEENDGDAPGERLDDD